MPISPEAATPESLNPAIQDQPGQIDFDPATLVERVDNLADGAIRIVPNLIIGLVVFALFYLGGRLVRMWIIKATGGRSTENVGLVLARLAHWGIVLIGLFVALSIVVPSITPGDLVAGLGVGGVAIGFAFKDILQNFLAGILLLLRQPFHVGDQIVYKDFEGTVMAIETRATIVKSYDGRKIEIPNGEIYTNAVTVNTAYEARRSQYDVGIGYGDDVVEACRVVLEAVRRAEGVLDDPAPEVLVGDLAGSSVNLRPRWWTQPKRSDVVQVQSDVICGIKLALDAAGIDMPYPTTVSLNHDQTEETDGDRKRQREGWPAGDNPPKPGNLPRALAGRYRSPGEDATGDQPKADGPAA